MKLLIDECIDERLRLSFASYDCATVRFAGLSGLKNGQLLSAAQTAGFEALITVDQNIPKQQNLTGRDVSVIIPRAQTNRLADLLPLVPAVRRALENMEPGSVVVITRSEPDFRM